MPLRVTGKNMDIGESLRTHVTQKVDAIIGRYFDGKVTGSSAPRARLIAPIARCI